MNIKSLTKYGIRFITLQLLLSYLTVYYFDNFLIPSNSYRLQIDANLNEDRERFFSLIPENLVKIDIFITFFIFLFLLFLYSTKFYTYVNELSFSLDKNFFDEYFSIFLTWTTSFILFITFFRFSNLISRGYLFLYLFLIPLILLLFRNTEFLSSLIGRSVTNEKYITFNLEKDSIFRNLRLLTFRKLTKDFNLKNINDYENIVEKIDSINKKENINLLVINFGNLDVIDKKIEDYLISLNKKVLIISNNSIKFNKLFLSRESNLSNYKLVYFNNDIQYGAKYIIKRAIDIVVSILLLVIFSPIFMITAIYIFSLDGSPIIIKQNRVGLHGKLFKMYKFRTMKNDSHKKRDQLESLSKGSGPLFKITNDPRLLSGSKFIRKYSIDELPQLLNIFRGEMSMVGPRPLFEEDTKLFEKEYMRRLNVLPGLTGLLQINDRNTDDFSVWYEHDIDYIDNWSLTLDLKIILKTPFSMFKSDIKGL